MAKPACGARKPIKNQEGQGMLDIDENSSVEDDMFENVKTDEDMDHEMEEEEGGSAFEEEIDSDESDQQEQAVIPKSQTPFLSDKDTPESYGELIGFMERFIEDQKAENPRNQEEQAGVFITPALKGCALGRFGCCRAHPKTSYH